MYQLVLRSLASNPVVIRNSSKILTVVSKATKLTFKSLTDLFAWAKTDKAASLATLSAIGAAGISLADLMMDSAFFGAFNGHKEVVRNEVISAVQAGSNFRVQMSAEHAATLDADADLKLNLGDDGDNALGASIMQWAGPRYGHNSDNVIEAHNMLRAFMELSTAQVTVLAKRHL